ncbi:uncharacterized protein STEHIDRAFT_115296 [Stereum hirsutum FP-91666 SS1]|uniref:uncharacterized protein n=1 Tax=Stereum hirsutum (strain FP-91666) TaxID=721885 RepID=UPI0004449AD9|nr:uncharacterized protein STEHIDRAFT_115296 [Stereum hirsutum FP-91666 SS1]EIM81149.1 hypothetical protein STEHIDRAFT_115296 [Stereum hirsutum FP-91666 SS1]
MNTTPSLCTVPGASMNHNSIPFYIYDEIDLAPGGWNACPCLRDLLEEVVLLFQHHLVIRTIFQRLCSGNDTERVSANSPIPILDVFCSKRGPMSIVLVPPRKRDSSIPILACPAHRRIFLNRDLVEALEFLSARSRTRKRACESHMWSHPSTGRQSYARQFETTLWGGSLSLWTRAPSEDRVKCYLETNTDRWTFAEIVALEYTPSGSSRWERLSPDATSYRLPVGILYWPPQAIRLHDEHRGPSTLARYDNASLLNVTKEKDAHGLSVLTIAD